jgi:AcrR family transcriptional regulator
VLAAAIECFIDAGYPATTIATIAARAGVAVQTVYAAFGTKRAVLTEAIDVAIAGDDEPVPVDDRPWMLPVWQAADGPATLRAYASAVRLIQGRVAPLFRALDVAAAAEPELHDLWEVSRQRRRLGAGGVVRAAAARSPLRAGLTIETAVDVVWALNGHELYLNLVEGCAWSPDRYTTWLGDLLVAQLFPSPETTGP